MSRFMFRKKDRTKYQIISEVLANIKTFYIFTIINYSLIWYKATIRQECSSFLKLPQIYRISYLPNPAARAGYDTRSIFKRSLTGLNSEFSFS